MSDNFKKEILGELKKNRPSLKDSSLKAYSSILFSLYNKMDGTDGLKFFKKEYKSILTYLKDFEPNKRKTVLSALFILTGIQDYRTVMIEDCKTVNQQNREQKSSASQKDAWISPEQIREKYNQYLTQVDKMFKGKMMLNEKTVIQFFLLALMSGVAGCPPRRSEDYGAMKIKNFDKATDNYYDKDKFIFQKYKTAKIYGKVEFNLKEMAPLLNNLIKKWIKLNETDYLLYSANKEPLTSSQISHHNNKIWDGKKVSTNIYRHVFLTDYFKNHGFVSLADMDSLAKQMSHSVSQQMEYVKVDEPK
jgi:hypothetical protein